MKCITIRCDGEVKTRGLCKSCYGSVRALVRTGKVSMEDLERRGLVLARKEPGKKLVGWRTEWFLNGKIEAEPVAVEPVAKSEPGPG